MKILLLLAIFCAVSYASIKPKWTTIKADSRFEITEVIAESAPVRGQYNTINICGMPKYSGDSLTGINYEIGANYGSEQNIKYEAGYVYDGADLNPGSLICKFFSFRVPPFAESTFYVTLYFSATENYMSQVYIEFNI